MTTRIEAFRAAVNDPELDGFTYVCADPEIRTQDLRDLLALYERAKAICKDPDWPVRHLTEAQWRAWKHLDVILARLETELP